MATKFADLGKGSSDLLNDDFTSKFTLKCKKNAGPVTFSIDTEQGKDGFLSSKVGSKFSYAKFNVDKGQVGADGSKVLETSLNLTPEIKVSFKGGKTADLLVDYTKDNIYATGAIDMIFSKASTSVCVGLPSGLKVGGETGFTLGSSAPTVSSFTAGCNYTQGPLVASVTAKSKFSQFNLGLLYKVNGDLTLACMSTHSSAKPYELVAVGGAFKSPSLGLIKAKIGTDKVLHACVTNEVAPGVKATASASVSPSDMSTFKPGFTVSL